MLFVLEAHLFLTRMHLSYGSRGIRALKHNFVHVLLEASRTSSNIYRIQYAIFVIII